MNLLANIQSDAIGLLIIILILIYGRKIFIKDFEQRVYNTLLITSTIELISDCGTWIFDGMNFFGVIPLLHFCTFIFYMTTLAVCILWVVFCDSIIFNCNHICMRHIFYFIPLVIYAILILSSIKTNWIYYYDEYNVYHRGQFYFISVLFITLYILCSIFIILYYGQKKNWVQRHDAYSLLIFIVPPLASVIIQGMFYGLSLPISISISMLLVFFQRQSALITTDPLTNLNNRRVYEQYVEQKLHNTFDKHILFLLMIDADNFKQINDTYGHKTGDVALITIANLLRNCCDSTDCLVRLGGDEFVIVGERQHIKEMNELIESIYNSVENENKTSESPYALSLSIGSSIYNSLEHPNVDALLHSADKHMYEVKHNKKNNMR